MLIPFTLMMEASHSPETSVLTIPIRRNIPEDGILHSHRRENPQLLHSINWLRRNEFPVRHELGFYISEDGNLHSRRHENLKPCIALIGWAL
jgi:hypothetical protein